MLYRQSPSPPPPHLSQPAAKVVSLSTIAAVAYSYSSILEKYTTRRFKNVLEAHCPNNR